MADPVSQIATGLAYGLRQLPRFAWYMGHGVIMRQLSKQAKRRTAVGVRAARSGRPVPDEWRLYADMLRCSCATSPTWKRVSTPFRRITTAPSRSCLRARASSFRTCRKSTAGERATPFAKC